MISLILSGDSYYIPNFKRTLYDYFGRRIKVSEPDNPEHIIAIGASIICDKLSNGFALTDSIQIH